MKVPKETNDCQKEGLGLVKKVQNNEMITKQYVFEIAIILKTTLQCNDAKTSNDYQIVSLLGRPSYMIARKHQKITK